MLDLGWPELLLVGVITVMVVGPKELPRVLRSTLKIVQRVKGLAAEFQSGLGELAKEADLEDIKKDMTAIRQDTEGQMNVHQLDAMLDPDNSIAGMFTGRPIRTPTPGEVARKKEEREKRQEAERAEAEKQEAEVPKLKAEPVAVADSEPPAEPPAAASPPPAPPKQRTDPASIPPAGPPKQRLDPASIPPAGPPRTAQAAAQPAQPAPTAVETPELEKRRAEA